MWKYYVITTDTLLYWKKMLLYGEAGVCWYLAVCCGATCWIHLIKCQPKFFVTHAALTCVVPSYVKRHNSPLKCYEALSYRLGPVLESRSYGLGVERSPNPDTSGDRCAKPIACQGPRIWINCLLNYSLCYFLYEHKVIVASKFWKVLPKWSLVCQSLYTDYTLAQEGHKTENSEEFWQPALGKPDYIS